MTSGQYVVFVLLLAATAGFFVWFQNRRMADQSPDADRMAAIETHHVHGMAVRCAQHIRERLGLSPSAEAALKAGVFYVHTEYLGKSDPEETGQEFAGLVVKKLKELGEFDESWDEKEVHDVVASIVADSLSLKDAVDTRPLEDEAIAA